MEKKLTKISDAMQKIEEVARSEIKNSEDYMLVCSSLMAVTRNMYAEALGPLDASRVFHAAADSFGITEDILEIFKNQPKPTIH